MKPGTFFRHKSLTKNWPGGRRLATVMVTKEKESYPSWNHRVINLVPTWENDIPTYATPLPTPSNDGGMAEPETQPSTAGLSTNDEEKLRSWLPEGN